MPRRLNVQRLIGVMGVVVLALGVLSLWVATHGLKAGFMEEPAPERALRQVRDQRGASYELRYTEAGTGRAVCGYAGPRIQRAVGAPGQGGGDAVAFVSRPNRILFADDPLPAEFQAMRMQFCPTFLAQPGTRPAGLTGVRR